MAIQTAREKIVSLYPLLSEADQLSILCDLIQSHRAISRSDDFVDALMPLDAAFDEAWSALANVSRWEKAA